MNEAELNIQEQLWLSYLAGGFLSKIKKTEDGRYYIWTQMHSHCVQAYIHQYFPSKSSILNPFSILNTFLIGIRFILGLRGILSPQFIG